MSNYSVNVFSGQGVMGFTEGKGTKAEVLDFVATLPGWFAKHEGWTGANLRLTIGRSTVGRFVASMDEVTALVGELTGRPTPDRCNVVPASPAQGGVAEGAVMRFTRSTEGGITQYLAEGGTFRYVAQRQGGFWELVIQKLETVAGVRVAVPGAPHYQDTHDTLGICKRIAAEFEALGDGFRSADHGHLERHTVAVLKAHDSYEDHFRISGTTQGEGDTMAKTDEASKFDVTTDEGQRALEEINANIERATSLAEADNAEALEELSKETETMISSLSGKGSIAVKKEKRDEFKAAATAQEKPKKKASAEVAHVKTYDEYEGVSELVNMGAEKVAEGVRLHVKTSHTARDIASVILDMWRRIPNKDGVPDIKGDSDPAKKASSALYKAAGEALEGDAYDVEQAVKKLVRSVQTQRTDVRAEYLRSLDGDSDEAQAERAHFSTILKDKPEDVPASQFVAAFYGVSLVGEVEKARQRYHEKKELAAGAEGEGEDEGEGEGEGDETTPDERIAALVKKLTTDVKKAKPEDFEKASEEAKEKARGDLEKLHKAIKDMITATL